MIKFISLSICGDIDLARQQLAIIKGVCDLLY